MSKVVKELVTKWTYKIDASQLTRATAQVAKLKQTLLQVRRSSTAFGKQERGQLRSVGAGWDRATKAVSRYGRAKERASRLMAGRGGGGGRGSKKGSFGGGGSGRLATLASTMGGGALGGLAIAGLGGLVGGAGVGLAGAIGLAGQKEQAKASIGGLLGGDFKQADALLSNLNDFAQKTPFQIGQLRELSSVLLAGGIQANQVVDSLRMLGDVTRGNNDKLNRMLFNFVQVKTVGKASALDLRQFAMAGIPIYDQLAKQLGKSREQISKMTSEGKINFAVVKEAFRQMTSEGGLFYRGMELQSQTLFGIFSNIKDAIYIIGEEIGGNLLPDVKKLAEEFKGWLDLNKAPIIEQALNTLESFKHVFKETKYALSTLITEYPLLGVALVALTAFAAPTAAALTALLLVMDDVSNWMRGNKSVIGDFIDLFKDGLGPGIEKLGVKYGTETMNEWQTNEENRLKMVRAELELQEKLARIDHIRSVIAAANAFDSASTNGPLSSLVSPSGAQGGNSSSKTNVKGTFHQTNNFQGPMSDGAIIEELTTLNDPFLRMLNEEIRVTAAN